MKVNILQLKRALSAALFVLLLSVAGKVFAEEEIVVGDGGTATNKYLPSYSYYKYSLTEQIYTAEEIGGSGYISRIAFYNDGEEKTRDYDIYMVNTVKESFESKTDWIAVTEDDLVYSGTVTMFSGGWTWIEFDTPFLKGESNIALVIDDNTGSYTSSSHMACRVFAAESQALYSFDDSNNYNPLSPPASSSSNNAVLSAKNQIKLGYESVTPTTYNISASANPLEGGTVNGTGTYEYCSQCILTAIPNEGYNFTNWTMDGEIVAINPTYNFMVTENASYVANFVEGSTVEIGNCGTATNNYLPSYSYYKYSLTEQIYTAEEIGGSGYISRIAFYNDGEEKTRDYDIYMVNTMKESFESNTDWIAVTEDDLVYSGTVTMFTGGWTWIEFDTPFLKGESNIALVIDDNTGSYTNSPHMACRVFTAESQALYRYDDSNNYNPLSPPTSSSSNNAVLSVKNQIKLGYENTTATTYSIAASASPADGGTITGIGNYEYYTQCTLTAIPNDGYVFVKWTDNTGNFISKETAHSFIVTSDSTFVAHFAEESSVCDITFDLNDSYGDGWNGNSLVVNFNDGSPQVLNLTITSGSSASYTLPIVNGSHVALSWISGNYIGECSFTVRYSNDNGIYHGSNLTSSFELGFDVNCEETPATAFDITTMANMPEWGTESGSGIYNQGQTCTLNATANFGYTFINWTKDGEVVSLDANFSFAVTESGDYIANFEQRHDMVFIGYGGTATNEYLPSYSLYKYALSQQIYTADEIVVDGVIDKISFYNDGATKTRVYDIYMLRTDKISFDSVTDWIAVTPEDLVFSGSITMEAGTWTTIALDTPFDYDNSSNLALIIDDNSGNYTSSPHMACRVFDANGSQAIRIYSDNMDYDPYDPTPYNGTLHTVKNQIAFEFLASSTPSYLVTVSANPNEGGTVNGGGSYFYSHRCTLTATPNEGYVFIKWTDETGTFVSNDSVYSFSVTSNSIFVAHFVEESSVCDITFELTDSDGDGWNGNSLVVNYEDGPTYLLTIPNGSSASYTLPMVNGSHVGLSWISGNYIGECSFTMRYSNGNGILHGSNLSSDFEYGIDVDCGGMPATAFDITVTANPLEGGTISGAGVYNQDQTCTLTATTNTGYTFLNWTKNGEIVSTDDTYNFIVAESGNYVANYQQKSYVVTVIANLTEGGTVMGGGTINHGQTCTVSAVANAGYVFMNWTDSAGYTISTDMNYSFTVTSEMILTANFIEEGLCGIMFDLHDSYGDGWNGNYLIVSFADGSSQRLTITSGSSALYILPMVNGSHVLLSWITGNYIGECSFTVSYLNGNQIYYGTNLSSSFEYEFDVDCEGTPITPSFGITASVNPADGGSVSGTGTYQQGQACTLTALAHQGYHFLNWTKNGAAVSTNAIYSFTVTENAEYVACFECDALGDFTYYSPTNNYMFTSLPISFSWDAVSGAKYYDLYLWDDGQQMPETPVAPNLTYCHYSPTPLQNYQTYHWLVKAKNSCYEQSLDVKTFSLDITPTLNVNQSYINYGEVALNGSASSSVEVSGIYLEDILNVQITGDDADMFSAATASGWDDYNGGVLIVTFNPTMPRFSYNANLVISSETLTRTVTLSGFLSDIYVFSTHVAEDVYAMNSQIPIYGSLTGLNNVPVPNAEVEIGVFVMGMKRTLLATTDANGQFSAVFEPMPSESGYYTINSGRMGNNSTAVHDDFNIPGMAVVSSGYNICVVTQDQPKTDSILIRNKSNLPLNNIQLSTLSAPDGCSFSSAPMSLGGLEEDYLVYTVTGSTLTQGNNYEEVRLKATSDEGAETVITIWYYCMEPRGVLAVAPNAITSTMTKGKSKIIDVMLTNNGTGETGSIIVDIPNVEWMSVVGSDTLPSLAVHDTAFFSLRLSPNNDIQLVQYSGTIGINSERGDAIGLPYSITAISDSTGTFVLDVTDDFTWNTNNGQGPHLEGAEITLKGYYSLETVAHGNTDANGIFQVDDLPEGYYRLQVTADRHNQYNSIILVVAGETNHKEIYLQYQAIMFTWTVEPTEIEDEYIYELNVEYETNVPVPVITIEHSGFHELGYGESDNFNLIITNHGLVSAFDTHIYFSESSEYTFAPLYDIIDTLPALSTIVVPGTYYRLNNGSRSGDDCDVYTWTVSVYYCNMERKFVQSRSLSYTRDVEVCRPHYFSAVTSGPSNNNGSNGGVSGGYPPGYANGSNGGHINGGSNGNYSPPPIGGEQCTPCVDALIKAGLNCASRIIPGLGSCYVKSAVKTVVLDAVHNNLGYNTLYNVLLGEVKCGAAKLKELNDSRGGLSTAFFCLLDFYNEMSGMSGCIKSIIHTQPANQSKDNMDNIQKAIDGLYYSAYYYSNELGFIKSFFPEDAWDNEENISEFFFQFESRMNIMTSLVSESDAIELASTFEGTSVMYDDIINFVSRWNRSVEYWSNNYFVAADLPIGYDTNFIKIDTVTFNYMDDIEGYFVANGYEGMQEVFEESVEEAISLQENASQSGVCAKITVQFSSSMTMTREAFDGTFTVHNGHDSEPMEAIGLDFIIKDEDGNVCNNLFQINTLSLNNLTEINGSGSLGASLDGVAKIQFIPTKYAAPTEPKAYYFGGTFSFIDSYTLDEIVYDLYPVEITVNPSPDLYVDYFMQRDILGDDALTTDVVEPTVPAELGVIIHNQGAGEAKNVTLETAEPQIIDNEKGLAIDFAMYGASFNGSPRQLGLHDISFGNIGSGQMAVGEWLFTSSLLGHFVSYEANVIHNSSYGNSDLSLVSHLDIHELIHPIYAYGNLDDGINDFLVNDTPDAYDTPDSIYFSHGGKTSVGVVDGVSYDHLVSPSDTVVILTVVPSKIGWNYGVTDDPGMNQYDIVSCIRNNDNQDIPLNNVWLTFVTIPDGGDPVYENKLHIVDTLSVQQSTTYTLVFRKKPSNLRIFHGNEDEYWSNVANWEGYIMPQADDEVLINGICLLDEDAEVFSLTVAENQSLTIPEDRILTVSGSLTNADPSGLVMEEGGQLMHTNTGAQGTVEKNILPYTVGTRDGWYLVASPLVGNTAVASVADMLNNNYDLYYYDEPTHYWINEKDASNHFTVLTNGKGYIYANNEEVMLGFEGELQSGSAIITVLLNYTDGIDLAGFNLVGNPYAHNVTSYGSVNVANGCFVMNEAKDDFIVSEISEANPLKPAEGFFVKAIDEDASITFNSGRGTTVNHNGSIYVELLYDGKLIDRLIVKSEGKPLRKFSLNNGRAKVFAMLDHREVAIVPCEGNEQPVNLTAAKNGTFTINVNVNNLEFDYLHLIDNLTGADVDLLVEPSYTFEAKTTDYASRFKLVFSVSGDADGDDAPFASINNGNIIIVGAEDGAILQIVDVLGHVILSGDAMNRVSTNGMTPGVYILRLINGEEVKTQKIVVE